MNLVVFLFVTTILSLLAFRSSKDVLDSGFIYGIPWVAFTLLLLGSNFNYDASSISYLYLSIGTIVFHVGYYIGKRRIIVHERIHSSLNKRGRVNFRVIKILIFFQLLFTALVVVSYYQFIKLNYSRNIFISFYSNRQDYELAGIVGYGRNIVLSIGLCILINYLFVVEKDQKQYKKYIIIEIILYLINTATKMTRNGILVSILPLLIIYLIITKQKNIAVIKKMTWAIVGFFALFILISVWKYWYLFTDNKFFETILDQIRIYGSGSIVAFQRTFDDHLFLETNGRNTFRFFLAIVDKIAKTNIAPQLEQPFIYIGNRTTTNVFTFYQYYVCDYGLIYALVIQFIIGYIHGRLYRKMSQMDQFGIYAYSIFVYSLVMQFFQDQYFSLTSYWIQNLVVGYIVLKTSILLKDGRKKGTIIVKRKKG